MRVYHDERTHTQQELHRVRRSDHSEQDLHLLKDWIKELYNIEELHDGPDTEGAGQDRVDPTV